MPAAALRFRVIRLFFRLNNPALYIPLLCMLLALMALWQVGLQMEQHGLLRASQDFEQRTYRISQQLQQRMRAYQMLLRASNGLFIASEQVTRSEWQKYVANLNIQQLYPGIQLLGYAPYLQQADYQSHIQSIQAEGFSDYQILPAGQRSDYVPAIYLEPFDWRNRRSFGFDMLTEPRRRAAMERARTSGRASLTAPLTLVQETDTDVQAGVLLFWPVYREATTQAPKTLQGYLYGAFRMRDLLQQLTAELIAPLSLIELRLTDTEPGLTQSLLFDSFSSGHQPLFQRHEQLELAGRLWQIQYASSLPYEQQLQLHRSLHQVLALSAALVLLLGLLLGLYLSRRQNEQLRLQRLNQQLRTERDRFSQLIEGAPIAMLMIDPQGRITLMNQQAEQLFGYQRSELLLQPLELLLPESMRAAHPELRASFNQNPQTRYMGQGRDLFARHKEGHEIPVEVGLTPIQTDSGLHTLSSIIDLRARRQAEEHFRLVVEASPNAVILTDAQGQIELVNSQTERLFGYPRAELLGQPIELLLPESLRERHRQLRSHYSRHPEARQMGGNMRLFGRHKSGQELAVEVGLAPIRTNGQLQIQAVVMDISTRLAAEQQLQEQANQLSSANRYKSEFLANMSHELRTPLNSILILSEQLQQSHSGLADKQRQHAEIIHRSGKDLLQLINDILDLSKIEAGHVSLQLETVHLSTLLAELQTRLQAQFERKGLGFSIQHQADLPDWIRIDAQKLQQILRNLLANALKFTLQGRVQLDVRHESISVPDALHGRPTLLFSIRDTGIGIAADQLEQIFIAFQQVDGSNRRHFGGTGLGLSISRQLSQLLGGDIEVSSVLGQGSEFRLYLPFEPATAPIWPTVTNESNPPDIPAELSPDTPTTRFAGKRILLVDDDMRNLYATSALLARFGLYVEHARSGLEALEHFEQGQFDLILMDISMPIMDGYESIRRLKLQHRCKTPIVALTAHAMKGDQEKCLQSGADDYLAKPIDQLQIENLLYTWLKRGSETKPSSPD